MSNNTILLEWDDTNIIEQGYRIYRSSSHMDIDNMPPVHSVVSRDSESFIDNDVTIGETYYYRVSSFIDNYELFSDEVKILARENVPVFVFSGDNSGHVTMQDIDGNVIWQIQESVSIRGGVSGDYNGNVYAALNDGRVIKYDSEGNTLWENTTQTTFPYNVSVNPLNNHLAVSFYNKDIVSYTSNGNIEWSYNNSSGRPLSISHDDNGYVFIGGYQFITKILDGVYVLSTTSLPAQHVYSMISKENYLYIGMNNSIIMKLDNNLNVIWEYAFNATDPIHGIDIDKTDNLYIAVGKTLYKMDMDRNILWEWLLPLDTGTIRQVDLSHNDDIFISTTWSNVYRISKQGETVWAFNENLSNNVYGVSTKKVAALKSHDMLSVEWEELHAPTPLGMTFTSVQRMINPPRPYAVTETNILTASAPSNIRASYDDTL